jgi:hypothetical protein
VRVFNVRIRELHTHNQCVCMNEAETLLILIYRLHLLHYTCDSGSAEHSVTSSIAPIRLYVNQEGQQRENGFQYDKSVTGNRWVSPFPAWDAPIYLTIMKSRTANTSITSVRLQLRTSYYGSRTAIWLRLINWDTISGL